MEIFSQKEFNFKQSEYFELFNQNVIEEEYAHIIIRYLAKYGFVKYQF